MPPSAEVIHAFAEHWRKTEEAEEQIKRLKAELGL
jgi:hypothetical protein